MSLMIPRGDPKNEVAGTHSFTVSATTVQGIAQTLKQTITMRISDPDCEPPAVLEPLLDSRVAYNDHALLDT